MATKDSLPAIRYFEADEPYHITLDNRPLLDLKSGLDYICDLIDASSMPAGLLSATGNYSDSGVGAKISVLSANRWMMINSSAGSNAKRWDFTSETTNELLFRTMNDDQSSAAHWLRVTRSGGASTGVEFAVGGSTVGTFTSTGLNACVIGATTKAAAGFTTITTTDTITANPNASTAISLKLIGRAGTNDSRISFYQNDGTTSQGYIAGATGGVELYSVNGTKALFITNSGANAPAFIPSSSTIPSVGVYLPSANTLGLSAGTTQVLSATSSLVTLPIPVEASGTATNPLTLTQTGTGDIGLTISRSAGTTSSWKVYTPTGTNDLRFYNGSDVLTITTSSIGTSGVFSAAALFAAGASQFYSSLIVSGPLTAASDATNSVGSLGGSSTVGLTVGAFTVSASPIALWDNSSLMMTSGSSQTSKVKLGSGNLSINTGGSVTDAATLRIEEPNLSLLGGSTLTNAYTVYITGAPTEGSNNYALRVASGLTSLGGNLAVTGTGTFSSTMSVTSSITAGAGGTGSALGELFLNGGSASGAGAYVSFKRNGVAKGYVGNESVLAGGSSDSIALWGVAGNTVKIFADATLAATFTGANTSLAGTLGVTGATTLANTTVGSAVSNTLRVNGTVGQNINAVPNAAYYLSEATAIPSSGAGAYGFRSLLLSDTGATGAMYCFEGRVYTPNSIFTLTDAVTYFANSPSKGAQSTITNWYGFRAGAATQATNNYGFYTSQSAGTGVWGFFGAGTAQSAFGGNVRIGSTVAPTVALDVTGAALISSTLGVTGATTLAVSGNGIGGAGQANVALYLKENATVPSTGASVWGVRSLLLTDTSATGNARAFEGGIYTPDAVFTLSNAIVFQASAGSKGASSTWTAWTGFYAQNNSNAGTTYGFYTDMASSGGGTKWAYYHTGTANSAINGNVRIGSTTAPSDTLDVTGTIASSGNVKISGNLGVGSSTNPTTQALRIASTISGASVLGLDDRTVLTLTSGANVYKAAFGNAGSITLNTGGAVSLAATAAFFEPAITVSNGSLTTAATVYIHDAPTEGSSNYALQVNSGTTSLGGTLSVTGTSVRLTNSQNATTRYTATNVNTGTGAEAAFEAVTNGSNTSTWLKSTGSGYTGGGTFSPALTGLLFADSGMTGGLSIAAREASADVRIYAGGIADGDLVATFADDQSTTLAGSLTVNTAGGNMTWGTYTPTLTDVSGSGTSATSPSGPWQYMRVGNTVTVSGQLVTTASGGLSHIRCTIPVASALTNDHQAAGAGAVYETSNGISIIADTVNDAVYLFEQSSSTGGETWTVQFSYRIL